MSGKRLLDAARIYGALKTVAKTHVTLRSQQLDTFTQTSTLAKAIKHQTDRVTVTAGAAYALAKRLAEDVPTRVNSAATSSTVGTSAGETSQQYPPQVAHTSGTGEDTFAERDGTAAATQPLSDGMADDAMHVGQKSAQKQALPDGTVPPADAAFDTRDPAAGEDTYGSRPTAGSGQSIVKQRLGAKSEVKPVESTRSTIPRPPQSSRSPAGAPIPSQAADGEPSHTTEDTFVQRSKEQSLNNHKPGRPGVPSRATNVDNGGGDGLNQDVYYSARPIVEQEPATSEELPEGVDSNVLQSPYISSALGGSGREDRRKAYARQMDAARAKAATTAKQTPSPWPETENDDVLETRDLAESLAAEAQAHQTEERHAPTSNATPYAMHESKVPSSRLGRIWQFSGLATGMALGAVSETFKRFSGSDSPGSSIMLSEANMNRLVAKLSRMRGAALKLGQMMSFQDSKMLPPAINAVLQRVQDSADYMPPSQRDRVLADSLGPDWRNLFSSFSDVPIAAASIGQVHRATLAADGTEVAVKVQYPGVRTSIDSDLSNLSLLLTASRLLPKGLFLDRTIANARTELGWECDYVREAECGSRFATLLADDEAFSVPRVHATASGASVLTTDFMHGVAVAKILDLTRAERDWIGTQVLRLCLRELTEWRFMQTDPNWTNFLYNRATRKIELLDFGASREFPARFVDPYVELLVAASKGDRAVCRDKSIELGYLTGAEGKGMLDAHVESILVLAEPFAAKSDTAAAGHDSIRSVNEDGEDTYDFSDQTITDRVRAKIGLMVRERLAPPPEETYSLHRKLSGAFLLCARLESRVPTRKLFEDAVGKWTASSQSV